MLIVGIDLVIIVHFYNGLPNVPQESIQIWTKPSLTVLIQPLTIHLAIVSVILSAVDLLSCAQQGWSDARWVYALEFVFNLINFTN